MSWRVSIRFVWNQTKRKNKRNTKNVIEFVIRRCFSMIVSKLDRRQQQTGFWCRCGVCWWFARFSCNNVRCDFCKVSNCYGWRLFAFNFDWFRDERRCKRESLAAINCVHISKLSLIANLLHKLFVNAKLHNSNQLQIANFTSFWFQLFHLIFSRSFFLSHSLFHFISPVSASYFSHCARIQKKKHMNMIPMKSSRKKVHISHISNAFACFFSAHFDRSRIVHCVAWQFLTPKQRKKSGVKKEWENSGECKGSSRHHLMQWNSLQTTRLRKNNFKWNSFPSN